MTSEPWYLTGPTASGKTAVGIELARRIDAEIISLDSMALYRGLDIGTAKPTTTERAAVPHHLIDILEPSDEFSVAQYLDAARQAEREIAARGKAVLYVGGTPLYLKSLLRGMFAGPLADWTFRRRLEDEAREQGSAILHARLREVDPAAAARLHANDLRRIIRALEVYELTAQPISAWQQQFDKGRLADECRVFVLDWPRARLHERIDRRVDAMFAEGLVGEVRSLVDRASREPRAALGRTAGQALGYREVLAHLRGECNLPTTIELVKIHTRQFAKRQGVWFRSLSECRPIAMDDASSPREIAKRIVAADPL